MRPTEPGTYRARLIVYGLGNSQLVTQEQEVEVVADVPNPRGHKLLVKTGLDRPKHRALDCYEWR